jgi:rhombotail lipoprotein
MWLVLFLVLSGCSTFGGFNRDLLETRLREDYDKVIDKDIKEIHRLAPQIRFPCRIAIALRAEGHSWRWTAKDRQLMNSWGDSLKKEGIASEVVFMSRTFVHGDDLHSLRASAAKYGADALLLIKGNSATDSRLNVMSVFNLTVVGGFVVPGSHRDALFQIEGALVDVNNGFLYASAEAEGEGSTLAPTFIIEEKDAIEKAKQGALTAFGPELLKHLRNLQASAEPVAPPQLAKP